MNGTKRYFEPFAEPTNYFSFYDQAEIDELEFMYAHLYRQQTTRTRDNNTTHNNTNLMRNLDNCLIAIRFCYKLERQNERYVPCHGIKRAIKNGLTFSPFVKPEYEKYV